MFTRYYLYNLAFQSWRAFIPLQKEKKNEKEKVQNALSHGMSLLRHTMRACLTLETRLINQLLCH